MTTTEAELPPAPPPLQGPDGGFAVSGDIAVFNGKSGSTHAVLIYRRSSSSWLYSATLLDPQPGYSKDFGASLAVSDNFVAVGADLAGGNEEGAVYVFRAAGTSWLLDTTLTLAGAGANAHFGTSVAVDGDTLFVGYDGYPATVYVYRRDSSGWAPETSLSMPQLPANSGFGLHLEADANRLAVGSPDEPPTGTVYVYEQTASGWQAADRLVPSGAPDSSYFGSEFALAGDTLAVGAYYANQYAGTTYVFQHDASGWTQTQALVEPDAGQYHWFGAQVSISGLRMAIGAPTYAQFDPKLGNCLFPCIPGTTYLYERSASGWLERLALQPSASTANDYFGGQLALSGNSLIASSTTEMYDFTLAGATGEPCASGQDCASGVCDNGSCAAGPGPTDAGADTPGAVADALEESPPPAADASSPDTGADAHGPPPNTIPTGGCACTDANAHGNGRIPVLLPFALALLAWPFRRRRQGDVAP